MWGVKKSARNGPDARSIEQSKFVGQAARHNDPVATDLSLDQTARPLLARSIGRAIFLTT